MFLLDDVHVYLPDSWRRCQVIHHIFIPIYFIATKPEIMW